MKEHSQLARETRHPILRGRRRIHAPHPARACSATSSIRFHSTSASMPRRHATLRGRAGGEYLPRAEAVSASRARTRLGSFRLDHAEAFLRLAFLSARSLASTSSCKVPGRTPGHSYRRSSRATTHPAQRADRAHAVPLTTARLALAHAQVPAHHAESDFSHPLACSLLWFEAACRGIAKRQIPISSATCYRPHASIASKHTMNDTLTSPINWTGSQLAPAPACTSAIDPAHIFAQMTARVSAAGPSGRHLAASWHAGPRSQRTHSRYVDPAFSSAASLRRRGLWRKLRRWRLGNDEHRARDLLGDPQRREHARR